LSPELHRLNLLTILDIGPLADRTKVTYVLHLSRPLNLSPKWRHWHVEQEARFAAERGRNKREGARRLDTRLLTVADVETLIAAALCAERQAAVVPIIGEAVNELLDAEREHAKSELVERTRGLEFAGCQARAALTALQLALNVERGKTIDLPNVLRAVN